MKVLLVLRQLFLSYVSQNVSQVIHRPWSRSICQIGPNCPLCLHGRYRAVDTGGGLQGAGYFADHALEAFQVWPAGSYLCAFFAALYQRAAYELYLAPAENLSEGSAK